MKGCVIFLLLDFRYNFPNIFNIISKSFATYECCHSCLVLQELEKGSSDALPCFTVIVYFCGYYQNFGYNVFFLNTRLGPLASAINLGFYVSILFLVQQELRKGSPCNPVRVFI